MKKNILTTRVLMLDNYDSFTYNIVQLIKKYTPHTVEVYRNNEITLSEIKKYDVIVLSPGPGVPRDVPLMCELIEKYGTSKLIFGVCLGMQAIAEVYGAKLFNLTKPYHGIKTQVKHKKSNLFKGLPNNFEVGRYHSWAVQRHTLPDSFHITAEDENNIIMAIEHKNQPVYGVQFHPESILTEYGKTIILNVFNLIP